MWLIYGLGNPGKKFQETRHNIGFLLIDAIVKKHNFKLIKKSRSKEIYKGFVNKNECLICKPLTYMNLSGIPISEIINFFKIPKSRIIVIHDDIDLSIGKIKIKLGGGNGGHNGLLNIDENIGVSYNRLRIGIGHPGSKELVNKYVLEKFNTNEKKIINNIIKLSVKYLHLIFNNKQLFLTKMAFRLKKFINGI